MPHKQEVVIGRNQERILSMLTGLVSDVSEMKRTLITSEIKILPLLCHTQEDNLTTLDRVDAMYTRLDAEQHNQEQILSILTGLVSDMSEMKRLIEPPEIKILPLNIQEEIMKRLPVKSLVRFRCVSRSWKSLIDSSEFIGAHKNQPQHLLVEYHETEEDGGKYICFADDDSFPHRSFVPVIPQSINRPRIVGSSYGLFCLYCYDSKMAVIWNPSIRKLMAIDVPDRLYDGCNTVVGFGVCPLTIDPKIVSIAHLSPPQARSYPINKCKSKEEFGNFWEVNVYKLSSGKFRNLSSNLPHVSIRIPFLSTQVVIDRLIYWLAEVDCDGTLESHNLIMSFDITEEKFKVVDLPKSLASLSSYYLSLCKLRESLVMLEYNKNHDSCGVWKMDHGLFTKLFTIKAPCDLIRMRAVGFRKTGGPIMGLGCPTHHYRTTLVVYEPNSKHCNNLILGYNNSFVMESYTESLILIDRSDCISTSFAQCFQH